MSKLQVLRTTLIQKRKAKETAAITSISTLIGEVERASKSKEFANKSEDDIVVMVLMKTKEGLIERVAALEKHEIGMGDVDTLSAFGQELDMLETFIDQLVPKQLETDELEKSLTWQFKTV